MESLLNKLQVRQRFNRFAHCYDQYAALSQEVVSRFLDRLELIKIQPRCIVELGCGTGELTVRLAQKFPEAKITAVDFSEAMLAQVERKLIENKISNVELMVADAESLPSSELNNFAEGSVDLVMTSLMLPWCNDLASVFLPVRYLLKEDGLFLFSSLGPDSLKNVRAAWAAVDSDAHVQNFLDLHDVGDKMLAVGLADPVMDVERLSLSYASVDGLLRELQGMGFGNCLQDRFRGLTGKAKFDAFKKELTQLAACDNRFDLSYEIIYGHAWKSGVKGQSQPADEFFISVDQIGRR